MKKFYSNEKRTPPTHYLERDSSINFKLSSGQSYSQIPTKDSNGPANEELYDLIRTYFPQHFPTIQNKPTNNFMILLRNFLKEIKIEHEGVVFNFENQIKSLEIELEVGQENLRNSLERVKKLEGEIWGLTSKSKNKDSECYSKNEEIFLIKQHIEKVEKESLEKDLEVKEVYAKFEKFKAEAYREISKHQNLNQTLKTENKVLGERVHFLEKKIDKSMVEHENEISYLRELSEVKHVPTEYELAKNKKSIQYMPSQSFPICSPSNSISSTIFSRSQNMERPSLKKSSPVNSQNMEELLEELNELKNNQSCLLDRLAERDNMIENLELQISHHK